MPQRSNASCAKLFSMGALAGFTAAAVAAFLFAPAAGAGNRAKIAGAMEKSAGAVQLYALRGIDACAAAAGYVRSFRDRVVAAVSAGLEEMRRVRRDMEEFRRK
ncbi:MAG: hypothetical protein AB1742_15090 [bacterium]